MLGIPSVEQLVHELSRLPGVGPKTAQRLAYYFLKSPNEISDQLGEALRRVQAEVRVCSECFSFTDRPTVCKFCSDPQRHQESLCVVEEPSDIMRIEGSGAFRGRYHVLHGVISPLDGVGPQDLKIGALLKRLQQSPITEVILALDADLEGDTTILYLMKQLSPFGIKISRIAHGVPMGSDIDYIDDRTMGRALDNRVEL